MVELGEDLGVVGVVGGIGGVEATVDPRERMVSIEGHLVPIDYLYLAS